MTLLDLSIAELNMRIKNKEISVSEVVEASLKQIAEVDKELNAFITIDEERARERAAELDRQNPEESGALFGIPMAIKDNLSTKDVRTTCASKILADFIPSFDATVVDKLNQAGTVMVGKANMDEFAMSISSETSAFGAVHNPWNPAYVPGGSSGGSAASVAARQVAFALGSDTGGSVRQPAAFCGVVGLKPTYGLVSRLGLAAYASSLDHVGTLTKTVEDAAYVLQVIAGHDPSDSTSAMVEVPDYTEALTGEIKGLRMAVPKEYMGEQVDPEVKEKVLEALKVLEGLGATWEEVSLPHSDYVIPAYYIIASAEASSNLARYDGVGYGTRAEASKLIDLYTESRSKGFGKEAKLRTLLGTYFLSADQYDAYFLKAQQVRTLIKQDFEMIFKQYDLLISPTTPGPAFKMGEKTDHLLARFQKDMLTIPANMAGIPAISVPCGFASNGLPIGLQMMGKAFDESTVLRAAHAFQQATNHHQARPTLSIKGEA